MTEAKKRDRGNCLNLTNIDDHTNYVLDRISTHTGLSKPQIVMKVIGGQLSDLQNFVNWFEQLPEDAAKLRMRGKYLMHSYGPEDLTTSIKELDPTYLTPAEKRQVELTLDFDIDDALLNSLKGEA